MKRRFTCILAGLGCAMPLAACEQPTYVYTTHNSPSGAVGVNEGYATSSVNMPGPAMPSLQDMEAEHHVRISKADKKEQLRIPAIRDAALRYGMAGGLNWGTKLINDELNRKAGELSRIYDFHALLIKAPSGQYILPPVISEMDKTFESSDAEQTIRIADTTYQIDKPASFTPSAPLWHSYLIRGYKTPSKPGNDDLPRNDMEQQVWANYVAEGWDNGYKQARIIFREDLARLKRDFGGMLLYRQLLSQGKVTAPVVAETSMGITGNGQHARYNDRTLAITGQSQLNVEHPDRISSTTSGLTPEEASRTSQGSVPTSPDPDNIDTAPR